MTEIARFLESPPTELPVAIPAPHAKQAQAPRTGRWTHRIAWITAVTILTLVPLLQTSHQALVSSVSVSVLALAAALCSLEGQPRLDSTSRILLGVGTAFVAIAAFQAISIPGSPGGIGADTPSGPAILRQLSFVPGATALGALRIAGYLVFFWLVLRLARSRRRAERLAKLVFALVALQAVYAITALVLLGDIGFGREKTAYLGAATGSFINRNALAAFCGFGLLLGLALLAGRAEVQKKYLRPMMLAGLIVIACALILTRSRMGLGASLAGAFAVLSIGGGRKATPSGRLLPVAVAGFGAALLLWYADRVGGSPFSARLELYRQVGRMISERPLSGFGLDSFPLVFQMYHQPAVWPGVVWNNAHSSYLTLWVESGLLAGSLPLAAGVIAWRKLWHRARVPLPESALARAGLGALTLGALHSTIDFSLETPANAYVLLTLVALGIGTPEPKKGPGS